MEENRRWFTEPIQDAQIVRRTFEGKDDPTKNDDPVTSKYYTSQRYAVVCMQYGNRRVYTCRTKQEAQDWIDHNSFVREL